MIRGTNAQFRFNLTYAFEDLEIVQVTFWQEGNNGPSRDRPLPIVKVKAQCAPVVGAPKKCSVTLNQEETLRFSDERKAYVQLRATTYDGIPIASLETPIIVYPVYNDSILDDDIVPTPTPDPLDGYIYLDGGSIV